MIFEDFINEYEEAISNLNLIFEDDFKIDRYFDYYNRERIPKEYIKKNKIFKLL